MRWDNQLIIRLASMLTIMGLMLFPGFSMINSFVDQALANPSVAESSSAPIIRLIPLLWLVGAIIGIPLLMARWVFGNR